jgi:mono/diheme cytochrome c family protein
MSARAWGPLLALSLLSAPAAMTDDDWVAPDAEKARPNPLTPGEKELGRGRSLYRQHCELCHGKEGRGDGPSARLHARNARPPQDLTRPEIQANMTDGEIFWKVGAGFRLDRKIVMPSFVDEIPSADDRWRVVLFVRTLERKETPQ